MMNGGKLGQQVHSTPNNPLNCGALGMEMRQAQGHASDIEACFVLREHPNWKCLHDVDS